MIDRTTDAAIASHLVDRVANMAPAQTDVIKKWEKKQKPDVFNGHIVLQAPRPSGGFVLLVGEFDNDGLAAAVGVVPTAEVFYGMVEKGFCVSDIVEELNKKLLFVLPEGMYLSACIMELEQEGKLLDVWNGGMPDFIVIDQQQQIKHRVSSSKHPLGIRQKIDSQIVFVQVDEGDLGYVYAETGEKNDQVSLDAYANRTLETFLLDHDEDYLADAFLNDAESEITLVRFAVSELNHLDTDAINNKVYAEKALPPSNWQINFDFQASVLKNVEIVPLMINALMHIQAPYKHRQRIYTVVAELCSNALDHGVLGLNSELKQSPNGFAEYYELRGKRLAELTEGYIKVSFSHELVGSCGKLSINVEDSGDGFDYQHKNKHQKDSDSDTFSGRGVSLLKQLCSNVYYTGKGNSVHVDYLWS